MTDESNSRLEKDLLRLESANTPLILWKCPYFCQIENVSIKEVNQLKSFSLQCEQCSCIWYVCFDCVLQHKHYFTSQQLRRHFHTSCKKKLETSINACTLIPRSKKQKSSTIKDNVFFQFDAFEKNSSFERKENMIFYFYDQFQKGPHYLVGLCQYKLNNIAHELDTYEVYTHFRLAYMFLTMNPLQNHYQTKIFRYYQSHLSTPFLKRKWALSLPLDKSTVRRMYTEGSNSILANLPYPNVLNVDSHSYVPMNEIIQDCLANSNPVCNLRTCSSEYNPNKVKYIWESKSVTDLIKEIDSSPDDPDNPVLHLMLLRWSDDFEPNNIKNNRGNSIWMFTTTIVSALPNHDCEENTYIVSLGHKDADHSEIEKRYISDIKAINESTDKKFYVATLKKAVSIKLHMVACIADLPERSEVCNISRGNGTFTTRWGFSSHTTVLKKRLRSCTTCFNYCVRNAHLETYAIKKFCNQCMNWDFERTDRLSSYDPPKDYPNESDKLTCFRLSFNIMKEACEVGRLKFISKQWTRNQLIQYLSHKGIKYSLINKIITESEDDYELQPVASFLDTNRKKYDFLCKHNITESPSELEPIELPVVWDSPYTLSKWIDAPMHLLFLGVVKKTNSVVDKWATLFSKQKQLMKSFCPMLPFIYSMKLEWCKILPLCPNLTFSGYVSENWVAVCRLMCWMYQTILDVLPNEELDTNSPEKHINSWTGAEMKKWLLLRGLKRNGTISELRSRISQLLQKPEAIPDIVPKFLCDNKISEYTIVSLQFLISRLMQKSYNIQLIKESECYTHLYLGYLAEWTEHITPKNKPPLWISSYSILNLLNLPRVMTEFGPLRNYWEGKTIGEAIVKKVKSNYKCMHPQWYMSLTKRTLQLRSFFKICDKIDEHEDTQGTKKEQEHISFKERATNFHIYPDILCLQRAYENSQPISVVITQNSKIFSVVCNDIAYELVCKEYYNKCFGLHYYKIELPVHNNEVYLNELDVCEFGLLLPKLTGNENFEEMAVPSVFTLITSEWKTIDDNKNIQIPNFRTENEEND